MQNSNYTFGNRLALLREQAGYGQEEFAVRFSEYINASKFYKGVTVSAWETGRKTPSINSLKQMCSFFNVTSDYLLGLSDDPGQSGGSNEKSDNHLSPSTLIRKKDYSSYDQEPVFIVFPNKEFENCWGLMDFPKQRMITSSHIFQFGAVKYELYNYFPLNEKAANYKQHRPLSMMQLLNAKKVYVGMVSAEAKIRAKYDGWYRHNEDRTFLVNSLGLVLPYDGLGISYNAYSAETY